MTLPESATRKYGIVVLGASGFTGTMVCTHIAAKFPTNLGWAVAGRSRERLDRLAAKLKEEYPDRVQPDLHIVAPDDTKALGRVIGAARVCISSVVYPVDGDPIIEACIEQRTDYVDCAGVPTLVRDWIAKYHEKAEANGVALIHSCGAMTGEMDLFAIHACHQLQQTWSARMGKMTLRVDDLDPNVSGGTMRTMLSFASGGPKAMAAAGRPSLLTPVPYTKPLETVRGIHRHPVLGLLTLSSPPSDQARTLINRSWGLLGGPKSSWGPNFQYNEYERAHSYLGAVFNLVRCYLILAMFSCVQYAWFRELLTRCAPDLGVGPSEEQIRSLPFTAAAFIEADPAEKENRGKGCLVKLRYAEGNYPFAAMLMAQAAATLLYDRNLSAGIRGGCLTGGVLGVDFVERARQGGLEIETTMIEDLEI
ncbi:Saccharopine dehydrogenase-like oxidoreductase [Colletotrichum sidae]|uniref:Saccharopine dehydrogenase-like oxidoreductase n=1 Tax=Colletotrichum sidae TaxID=1347389 RepID=A0A4V3I1S7_9PEZI|nr:Saccharopine dehydrogenase-like oxidoreductase [Colletotrichum sidae]